MTGLLRRQRRGEEALVYLAEARAAAGDASQAQFDLTELVIQLRLGDVEAAEAASFALGSHGSPVVDAPAVQYWTAVCAICCGERENGRI